MSFGNVSNCFFLAQSSFRITSYAENISCTRGESNKPSLRINLRTSLPADLQQANRFFVWLAEPKRTQPRQQPYPRGYFGRHVSVSAPPAYTKEHWT